MFLKFIKNKRIKTIDKSDHKQLADYRRSLIKKEKKEYENYLLLDESDLLIFSLGGSIWMFGITTIFSNDSTIPNVFFLATALFTLHFSLTSILRPSFYKSLLTMMTFPNITVLCAWILLKDFDLNRINNGLSLVALSISLTLIPLQKKKTQKEARNNKVKNEIIEDLHEKVDEQEALIIKMTEELNRLKSPVGSGLS